MRPKKVILCVGVNEHELSVLKFTLSTNGYRVVTTCSAQEAIGIFAQNQVDLVLAELVMPKMNGIQLVDRLKQIASHIPMILLGDPQKMGGEMHTADTLLSKKSCSVPGAFGTHQSDERAQARTSQGFAAAGAGGGTGGGIVKKQGSEIRDQGSE